MKTRHFAKLALGAALSLTLAPAAFAAGTDAGLSIDNTASVDYEVNGINQDDVPSTTDSFVVDRRILFTLSEVGGTNTLVTPGASARALTFSLTNDTNDTLDFRLSFAQDGGDDFEATGPAAYYLDDGDNIFDGGDTLITFLDEVPEGGVRVIHVVHDIPSGLSNGDLAAGTLTAIAAVAGTATVLGADHAETAGADTAGSVDTVFGELSGPADADYDGTYTANDAYEVQTATITVTKTSRVIDDPFNGVTDPKRIPGATIEYCITVENAGASDADAVVVTDGIPAGTTYVPGSIRTNVGGTGTVCDATGDAEDDDAAGVDETNPAGGSFSANTVTVQLEPSISSGGGIRRAAFQVTID